ncbi:chromosome segregation ATPase [Vibrio ishigakensis]|uniref:Chromosome segregation ATPase n=1 Tax=Vibrio ishigakensis TaxID=1481914 RepID=A0A0B8PEZ7_9VIBR|nr:restriction endonuclease subunit S [Vibrio ishigakensis]GAM59366.1 chromosome segregation ATPase [Vibrio ishigakensis]GAM63227.1 chromosome segregation ATPase [Vibrio ishigakensis]GAM68175.1 protein yaeH [Vibrio sp. JCM 19236]GAM73906.1 protein yaeH [Vibrio ishigakensis]
MSDFEKELQEMAQGAEEQPEEKLPTIEEQKRIAAELKKLEEAGELTPEVLEEYFGKFYAKTDTPIH